MIQITNGLNSIPEVLQFFLPGYLGITLLSVIINHKFAEYTTLLTSISSSVIVSSILMFIADKIKLYVWYRYWAVLGVSIVIMIGIAALMGGILKTKLSSHILSSKFHASVSDNVLHTVIGNGDNRMVHIHYKDGKTEVIGEIKSYDIHGKDKWIALQKYAYYDCQKGIQLLDYSKIKDAYLIISFDEIRAITVEPMVRDNV